ncbi:MAG: response regulator [Bacteroidia bacterium]|nr:response regulator [Bacteroidia bacterium]
MLSETGRSNNNSELNKSSEELFDKSRKNIETFSIIALLCMIAAVLLITFDQRLFAGCMIIAGASICIFIFRKISVINNKTKETLFTISSSNKRKDDIIKDFSHKIRETLNSLVIIVDVVMESGLRKEQKELIQTFIVSTNNMVSTVNELTMKSAGNMSFEQRKAIRFNLFSTIQSTIELYNLKDKVKIDFILNKKEFSDFECFGDPIILKQIFLNIFSTIENDVSERATKVTINLGKSKITETESIISLKIQTDRSMVLIDDKGIERSQSALLISSGKGTYSQEFGTDYTILNILFPFDNPASKPKQKTASPKIEELRQKEKTHKDMKDLKILLVEDNLINQKITFLTLNPLVNSIDTASNGKEALDKFGTVNYDLILMDIQMPIMNGMVVAEKIRAIESTTNSHIPIIAITANAMIGDMEKCLSAGIDDYISKPFQPSSLIEKIKNII